LARASRMNFKCHSRIRKCLKSSVKLPRKKYGHDRVARAESLQTKTMRVRSRRSLGEVTAHEIEDSASRGHVLQREEALSSTAQKTRYRRRRGRHRRRGRGPQDFRLSRREKRRAGRKKGRKKRGAIQCFCYICQLTGRS